MSSLQDRIYAQKWFALAVSKNKLAYFVIGIPPYAAQKPSEDGECAPVLGPNLEVLYDHYEASQAESFNVDVENAVLQIVDSEGEDPRVILHALVFIITHLAYEKRGAAKFSLDCPKILEAIKKKVAGQNASDVFGDCIVFYDDLLRKQHGLRLL